MRKPAVRRWGWGAAYWGLKSPPGVYGIWCIRAERLVKLNQVSREAVVDHVVVGGWVSWP